MIWLFWLSLLFLAYTFVGYPLFLVLISWFRELPHQRDEIFPEISLIIPVHNGAGLIGAKIKNTLELRYPREKFEIIVVSDASDDGTVEIVRTFSGQGVRLIELRERQGKHRAQMAARDASSGEILVFTDASVHLEPEAMQRIVSNFADGAVGCVSSEDRVLVNGTGWAGERTYVGFETRLRRLESNVNSLVGVSGSFFAARREVCDPWHAHQSSDFFVPLHVAARGLRNIVDPECVGYYYGLVHSESEELPRKVRTIAHGLVVLFSHFALLNPVRYGLFSWQLFSHKLCRWLVPFAVICLAASNMLLWRSGIFYQACLVGQLALYGLGLLGQTVGRRGEWKPVKVAAFFLMANIATLAAWFKYFSGETYVTWSPSRRS